MAKSRPKADLQRLLVAPEITFATADGLIDDGISGAALEHVRAVAARRQAEAVRANRPNKYGAEHEDGGLIHLLGACGEYAVASALGVAWSGSVNTFKAPDILDFIQVRTRSWPDYELLVRDSDSSQESFVLVTLDLTAALPALTIHGWIEGTAAKVWWNRGDPGGRGTVYLVAQLQLEPLPCSPLLDRVAARQRQLNPISK
jgi:hypothetical protein